MNKIGDSIFLAAIVIIITQLLMGILIYSSFESWGERGTFGDMFGAVNTLFSGLAFAGVIIAIFMQRSELELQREELKLTRKELKKSANASERQAKHFESQRVREDLYRLIYKLTERVNDNFNNSTLQASNTINQILVLKHKNKSSSGEVLDQFYSDALNMNTKTYRVVQYITADLSRLMDLIRSYEVATAGTENCTPFPDFYRSEYKELVELLLHRSLINTEVYNFFHMNNK